MSITMGDTVRVDCPATPSLNGHTGVVVGMYDGAYDVTGFMTFTVRVNLPSGRQRVFNFNADELTEVASA